MAGNRTKYTPEFKLQAVRRITDQRLMMLRAVGFPTNGGPTTWSLYVEVAFYVVLPLYVLVTGRWAGWAAAFVGLMFADPAGGRELRLWKYFFLGIAVSGLVVGHYRVDG